MDKSPFSPVVFLKLKTLKHRKSNIICLKCSCNTRPNEWARDEVVRSLVRSLL